MEEADSGQFFYNSNNQMIAMVGSDAEDSISFQYNSSGNIANAAFISGGDTEYNLVFTWAGNKVTMAESDYPNGKAVFELNSVGQITRLESFSLYAGLWEMEFYMLYNWQNDNLISTETWTATWKSSAVEHKKHHSILSFPAVQQSSQPGNVHPGILKQDFFKEVTETFSYDSNINPYKDFQIYKYSEVGFYNSQNNVVSAFLTYFNQSGGVEDTYSENYDFIYNPDTYPFSKTLSGTNWYNLEEYQYE